MFSYFEAKWPFINHPRSKLDLKDDVAGHDGGQRLPGKSKAKIEPLPPQALRMRALKEIRVAEQLVQVPIFPAAPGPAVYQMGILESVKAQLVAVPHKTNQDLKLIAAIDGLLRKLHSAMERRRGGFGAMVPVAMQQKPDEEGKQEEDKAAREEEEEKQEFYEQDLLLHKARAELEAEKEAKKKVEQDAELEKQDKKKDKEKDLDKKLAKARKDQDKDKDKDRDKGKDQEKEKGTSD